MGASTHKPKNVPHTPNEGMVHLFSRIVVGATGAITTQTREGASGLVLTRTSTGLYAVAFSDTWDTMLHFSGIIYNAGTPKGNSFEIYSKLSAKALSFSVVSDAGAAEDPTSGDEMFLHFVMSNAGYGPDIDDQV